MSTKDAIKKHSEKFPKPKDKNARGELALMLAANYVDQRDTKAEYPPKSSADFGKATHTGNSDMLNISSVSKGVRGHYRALNLPIYNSGASDKYQTTEAHYRTLRGDKIDYKDNKAEVNRVGKFMGSYQEEKMTAPKAKVNHEGQVRLGKTKLREATVYGAAGKEPNDEDRLRASMQKSKSYDEKK